jgi:hypothetical protein
VPDPLVDTLDVLLLPVVAAVAVLKALGQRCDVVPG